MNLRSIFTRSTVAKSIFAATAAAALIFSAPAKSDAQVFVAARIGRPAPIFVAARPTPYEIRRREEVRREEIRHAEWLRAHRYDRYRYGYYR